MAYTKNTWVDQDVERPKTYEVINNQDGSITLTDSFGLVQELGTPVNADNMNHIEDGIADLDNSKADKDKVINHTQIPPVILNAPNGVFTNSGNSITVKQGLRLTLPNGVNTDGTLNNTEYEVAEDITQTISPSSNATSILFFAPNEPVGNKIGYFTTNAYYIQDTEPFTPATGLYGIWFSRKDNKIRYSLNGSAWTDYLAIAIGTVKTDANGNVTNIYPYIPIRIPEVSMVDGQWVNAGSVIIVSNLSLNGSSPAVYTLNSLPNDGHYYEVIVSAEFSSSATSGQIGSVLIGSNASDYARVCGAVPRSNVSVWAIGSATLPVSSDRTLIISRSTGDYGTVTIRLQAYRRIGTNA